ncbi:RNA polymerase sigma factor [Phyllobacterium endophyticum]|uniref:RNA polymerase sigma factor n=1 Tax=Phyllobacterium endophyticum TaxID=1149773 RepID=UPI0011CBE757|nr:RNA polymerase sigma factor [Phyllobacterium endophyticum]TXR47064.1 RNA polymerase sigma factor [Phyllobacterium endophyticum]
MKLAILRLPYELDGASDDMLVALARQGGENAIRTLIKRNNQRLFRVVRAVVRDDSEAEDVVQETYVKAFTRLKSFRGSSRFSTWLTRIALNEAIGRVRLRCPVADFNELYNLSEDSSVIMFPTSMTTPSADSELARKEVRDLLERVIDDLPAAFRIVFILRDIEELSVEETAEHLCLKPETVKTRLFRARRLLRAAIQKRVSMTFSDLFPFGGARCEKMVEITLLRLKMARGTDVQ